MLLGTALVCPVLPARAAEGAGSAPFAAAVAVAAADDPVLAEWYGAREYRPLWTGPADAERRAALLAALDGAALHGLPVARYDAGALRAAFAAAVTEGDRGRLELRMTRAFLDFARDLKSGVLEPEQADAGIHRVVNRPDPLHLLAGIEGAAPERVLRDLPPDAPEYARLVKEKLSLEAVIAAGGWGAPVGAEALEPGESGAAVVRLRDRLVAMGYLNRSATAVYDRAIQSAVQRFQIDHGLNADGVAGPSTIAEIDVAPEERVKSVVVAMERLRWMHDTVRGARHIWVNQPDFTARIVDHGKVTFQTRAVIGKNVPDQRSPEFSDEMDHMVINPSWGVPRSIIVKEYLPLLQQNPNAVSHLQVIDRNGRVVPRGAVNFASYSARSFPFGLRQPPSDGNALGKVKFMFPNPYNIYLHDTPAKELFDHEVRAYSHGCIRLADPFDFAYALLAAQSADPKGLFQTHLDSDRETVVKFDEKLPVHLVYFTAWPTAKGEMTYRRDIYGRDARIFEALVEAGVALRGVQG
ncbi:L,D-transpeptidase family protein [Rhodobacteraceae bacterium HSP-20]|uniref:L,D-transpeptidase family protein n=1 Tax=Paragemmobacter amnigenus TaxID=2852097 RepID=A0ABS6J7A3_9RHOB|nr:L,D-transpeptidase family protein [Rhodobacter amnigenus]MBV4390657.1 L,D-transpeptidase family protein [Rhodobacter amnigenus]